MIVKGEPRMKHAGKSIFRSLFVPLFLIMVLQAGIFYFAAVYGGIEESLNQNAADILSERLVNRKNEIENRFNTKWSNLESCDAALRDIYELYEAEYGAKPFVDGKNAQISFLRDSSNLLIDTLRRNEVNGVFLILNDTPEQREFIAGQTDTKYGLCIRDMDQESNYTGTEDLLLERAPSSIVDFLGCSLDSWWEATYSFDSAEDGAYYYEPLNAAWENPGVVGDDIAYCSGAHNISRADPTVISYSIPLIAEDGYPYGVLGVEISTRYLASLMPNRELNDVDKCCYILARQDVNTLDCIPIVGSGTLYSRCFGGDPVIHLAQISDLGGFKITGRGNIPLYGVSAPLNIYNNNNPFEDMQLTLLALVEESTLFAFSERIRVLLMIVALISLALGLVCILLASRRFAAPITALAGRVSEMSPQSDFKLGRLGIREIDQLVDSIETLNQNVSRNIARTEFFSRMSHDMRTPMNAIISFSSPELLEDANEAIKDDYLEKIHSSGEYLLALINEVLDMTKIESNKTELHLDTLHANALFDTVISIIEKLAQKKELDFTYDVSVDDSLYVLVDEQHFNQIVMNLLSNAVKFTPTGGSVRLTSTVAPDAEQPERMRFTIVVADTGIGMSEEFVKNIYTPFEQENSRHEGTGLGLSIAKKLTELMGGTINCVSRKNVGTTFTLCIPLSVGAAENAIASSLPDSPKALDYDALRGKRILVCEDNGINAQIICNLLERRGIVTEVAIDGQAGVKAFAASEPGWFDAVLMDVQMPIMNGYATTRAIRALERPDSTTVPIIAMTANAFTEDVQACMTAGMNAHLAKPINPPKLYETLIYYMTEHKDG